MDRQAGKIFESSLSVQIETVDLLEILSQTELIIVLKTLMS